MSRLPLFPLAALALAACLPAQADTIDHLTLTTSAYGATNVTSFSFVDGSISDSNGYSQVTIDSDPTKTGKLSYLSGLFVLAIYSGQNPLVQYSGTSLLLGTSVRVGGDENLHYHKVSLTPGSYSLANATLTLAGGERFSLDSATLNIMQGEPIVTPIFPVAPPPAAAAATPEPSTITLLGTGLLTVVGVIRRRLTSTL